MTMKPKFYSPGMKATAALELLMKTWEVERKNCTPMEKAGFTMLVRRKLVQNKKGTYTRPDFETVEELEAWFDWLEDALRITRHVPVAVDSSEVNAQRNTDGHIGQQVKRD